MDVHFLVPDMAGAILGKNGFRFRVACEPLRDALALHRQDTYTASGDPRAVTCRSCQGTPAWQGVASLVAELKHALITGEGCCG